MLVIAIASVGQAKTFLATSFSNEWAGASPIVIAKGLDNSTLQVTFALAPADGSIAQDIASGLENGIETTNNGWGTLKFGYILTYDARNNVVTKVKMVKAP